MSSLRVYLAAALLTVVVLAVGSATLVYIKEVSARLEADLAGQGARATGSLRTEFEQIGATLDSELERLLDPRGEAARAHGSTTAATRYLFGAQRLDPGRLELLKVVDAGGTILSSGHWPASLGAREEALATYRSAPGVGGVVLTEPTPRGSAPSVQRWAWGRWGEREVLVAGGRFLDSAALETIRARLGVDVLALCSGTQGDRWSPCIEVAAGSPELASSFLARDDESRQALSLHSLELDSRSGPAFLVVGLNRAPIERVRATIRARAVGLGAASGLLALLMGMLLARRILRPVEALAAASGQLAAGDLEVRVSSTGSRLSEIEGLVESFNQMAEEIQRSQTQLIQAERVAAWREIARGLAHELKNPLTPILGAMDVVRKARRLDRPDFDEILLEQAGAVVEEVMRLKRLSDSFASFARLPEPRPESLDLPELLDHAVALYAGRRDGISIAREYTDPLPPLHADRSQIQTVLVNLVKNALEAMGDEGTLTLGLATDSEQETVEIRVQDSGPGIPDAIRERLFTPYFTTKGSRGTGLGLALAHRIVLEHSGRIEVASPPDGGACFVIHLPVGVADPGGDAPPESPGRGPAHSD